MANATDNFILSLLQPNSIISYTIQVINTTGNIVGSTNTGRFILPPIMLSTTGFPKHRWMRHLYFGGAHTITIR